MNQEVATRVLERMGLRADVASDGLEVIEALNRQSDDVVLMDVQMPEMDGLEAARRIDEMLPRASQPYAIAMTANAMPGDRERSLEAGTQDDVAKPVQQDRLADALRKAARARAGGHEVLERTAEPERRPRPSAPGWGAVRRARIV